MTDLRDLYQELILDHNRRPRNCGELDEANRQAEGYNPLCGDRVAVFLKVEGDVVREVSFKGSGCAISTASASLMTQSLKGKTLVDAKAMFRKFHGMLTGEPVTSNDGPALGKLEVFSGVCKYPARVKCATLVWHTVNAALEDDHKIVSTE